VAIMLFYIKAKQKHILHTFRRFNADKSEFRNTTIFVSLTLKNTKVKCSSIAWHPYCASREFFTSL